MSSHNSAISSRTDLNPVVSSQSLYIATLVGRLCCTHLLIHYNASLPNPCIIVFGKPEVYLFLIASSFLLSASRDSPVAFLPHFPAHWLRCYVCLCEICFACCAWRKDTVALQLLYNTDKIIGQSFWL